MVTEAKVRPFRELKKEKGEDNFSLYLAMHSGQRKVHASEKRFILMLAGAQSGKTTYGPHWLKREIERRGEGDYLVVTASYSLLEKRLLKEFREVFEHLYHLGEYHESAKMFESYQKDRYGRPIFRVLFATAVSPEGIESAEAKGAWLDEAGQVQFRSDSWDAVIRRVSLNKGRVLLTTTPYTVSGWLKREIYDRWADGDPEYDVIQFASNTNPSFPQDEFDRLRASMPAWKFNMMHRGMFDKPIGLVYDSFDSEIAVVKRLWQKPPEKWACFTGHDFGGANMACLWYAQDPDTGYFYLYREYLESGSNVGGHAQKFKALSEGENIVKSLGGAQHEDGWRDAFRMAGWPIAKPKKNVEHVADQIARVYQFHALNKVLVFSDMTGYIDEKMDFSYQVDDTGKTEDKYRDESKYHRMAAERYILSDFTPELVTNQRAKAWARYSPLQHSAAFDSFFSGTETRAKERAWSRY